MHSLSRWRGVGGRNHGPAKCGARIATHATDRDVQSTEAILDQIQDGKALLGAQVSGGSTWKLKFNRMFRRDLLRTDDVGGAVLTSGRVPATTGLIEEVPAREEQVVARSSSRCPTARPTRCPDSCTSMPGWRSTAPDMPADLVRQDERRGHPEASVVLLDRLRIVRRPADRLDEGPVLVRIRCGARRHFDLIEVRHEQGIIRPVLSRPHRGALSPAGRVGCRAANRCRLSLRRIGVLLAHAADSMGTRGRVNAKICARRQHSWQRGASQRHRRSRDTPCCIGGRLLNVDGSFARTSAFQPHATWTRSAALQFSRSELVENAPGAFDPAVPPA